jgi:putative glutamine transport system substrate-binding protein
LEGKKVGIPQGSVYATALPKASKGTVVLFNNDSAALDAMMKNQVDATTNNDANLYGLALLNPAVKVVGAAYTSEGFGVGVAKGNAELLDAMNVAIKNIKSTGKWKTIWKTEIGDKFGIATVPEPPPDNWK